MCLFCRASISLFGACNCKLSMFVQCVGNIWKIITGSIVKLSSKFYAKREMYVMFEAVACIASNNLSD